jgi:hypothetical protein
VISKTHAMVLPQAVLPARMRIAKGSVSPQYVRQ